MATSSADPCLNQVVKAFVQLYYMVLSIDPEICNFYNDSSILSRLDSDSTTIYPARHICNLIRSLDLKHCKIEIISAGATNTRAGLDLIVTGIFTEKDERRRFFTQSLLLDLQDTGFVVLKDIFWFHKECGPDERKDRFAAVDDTQAILNQALGSEKMTENMSKASEQSAEASASQNEELLIEVKDDSVLLSIFPPPVTSDQLETEFNKFGPVKQIEIFPYNMHDAFVYAWIKFQDSTSVVGALKASPITLGNKRALVGIPGIGNQEEEEDDDISPHDSVVSALPSATKSGKTSSGMAASPAPSSTDIAKDIVDLYYWFLQNDPLELCVFYKDTSVLSCPDPHGVMTTANTTQGICNLIPSLNLKNCNIEKKTVCAQDSVAGVLVLVTGIITEKDGQRRLFSHSLLLDAPENEIVIHNDILWYHNKCEQDERKGTFAAVDDTQASPTQALGSERMTGNRSLEQSFDASTSTASGSAYVAGREGAQTGVDSPSDPSISSNELPQTGRARGRQRRRDRKTRSGRGKPR